MNKQVAVSKVSSKVFPDPVSLRDLPVSLRELAPGFPSNKALPELGRAGRSAHETVSLSPAALAAAALASAVPLSVSTNAEGSMRISRYPVEITSVPVDFFADPDGAWNFDSLVESAGFDPENPGICIGALIADYDGHPSGSAVITELGKARSYVAIVECPAERTTGAEVGSGLPASGSNQIGAVTRAA